MSNRRKIALYKNMEKYQSLLSKVYGVILQQTVVIS